MTVTDIPAGLSLCRAAHWNQTAADWEFFLAFTPAGALVADERGVVIGTVATVPYGPFTWISMVLVDPAFRGRGVGRLLLERGLALVPESVVARLDATPAGEPLYRTLGFAPEHAITRWFIEAATRKGWPHGDGPATHEGWPHCSLYGRPLGPDDWPPILQMDRHVFGASRARLLQHLAQDAPDVLLHSCLASQSQRGFFIDAPDRDDGWRDVLASLGFASERPFLRMHKGRLSAPGNPGVVYAVTGPEFG